MLNLLFVIGILCMVHEWALAESIVRAVLDIVRERKLKAVLEVKIAVGQLQQIEVDIFRDALKEISEGTLLKETRFSIEEEEAKFKCRNCGYIWKFNEIKRSIKEDDAEAIHFIPELAHAIIRCPRCGSPDFIVVRGRGVRIVSLRGIT